MVGTGHGFGGCMLLLAEPEGGALGATLSSAAALSSLAGNSYSVSDDSRLVSAVLGESSDAEVSADGGCRERRAGGLYFSTENCDILRSLSFNSPSVLRPNPLLTGLCFDEVGIPKSS